MTTKDVIGIIQKITAPLERRVRLMVSRAVVALVDDSLRLQGLQVQLLAGEVRDDVERVQQYGFTSHPFPGAEGVFLAAGGSRDHGLIVAVDDRRYRPLNLAEGEVALYTHEGVLVRLRLGPGVDLGRDPSDYVALSSPTRDELVALRNTVNSLVQAYNAHTHAVSGTASCSAGGGPVSATAATTTSTTSAPAAVGSVAATQTRAK